MRCGRGAQRRALCRDTVLGGRVLGSSKRDALGGVGCPAGLLEQVVDSAVVRSPVWGPAGIPSSVAGYPGRGVDGLTAQSRWEPGVPPVYRLG